MHRTLSTMVVLGGLLSSETVTAQYIPPNGFVPDAATAIALARAILIPIYGVESIRRKEPLVAVSNGDQWIINGTLPRGLLGGVAEIVISKSDGRIVRVIHGR